MPLSFDSLSFAADIDEPSWYRRPYRGDEYLINQLEALELRAEAPTILVTADGFHMTTHAAQAGLSPLASDAVPAQSAASPGAIMRQQSLHFDPEWMGRIPLPEGSYQYTFTYTPTHEQGFDGVLEELYQGVVTEAAKHGIERFVFVGYSMGGLLSLFCAGRLVSEGREAHVIAVDSPLLGLRVPVCMEIIQASCDSAELAVRDIAGAVGWLGAAAALALAAVGITQVAKTQEGAQLARDVLSRFHFLGPLLQDCRTHFDKTVALMHTLKERSATLLWMTATGGAIFETPLSSGLSGIFHKRTAAPEELPGCLAGALRSGYPLDQPVYLPYGQGGRAAQQFTGTIDAAIQVHVKFAKSHALHLRLQELLCPSNSAQRCRKCAAGAAATEDSIVTLGSGGSGYSNVDFETIAAAVADGYIAVLDEYELDDSNCAYLRQSAQVSEHSLEADVAAIAAHTYTGPIPSPWSARWDANHKIQRHHKLAGVPRFACPTREVQVVADTLQLWHLQLVEAAREWYKKSMDASCEQLKASRKRIRSCSARSTASPPPQSTDTLKALDTQWREECRMHRENLKMLTDTATIADVLRCWVNDREAQLHPSSASSACENWEAGLDRAVEALSQKLQSRDALPADQLISRSIALAQGSSAAAAATA